MYRVLCDLSVGIAFLVSTSSLYNAETVTRTLLPVEVFNFKLFLAIVYGLPAIVYIF